MIAAQAQAQGERHADVVKRCINTPLALRALSLPGYLAEFTAPGAAMPAEPIFEISAMPAGTGLQMAAIVQTAIA